MGTIGDLLDRDLSQQIEEIVKVDQADEQAVHTELTEYVATDRLRGQYRSILNAIADSRANPHEGIGVWVSGFFGSGKSYFAKNLGYVLSNHEVLGESASELFKRQVEDQRVADFLDVINTQIPCEVIMFDVSVDTAIRHSTEQIAEIMYSVVLRELDYATDFEVAELEIELEEEDRLEEFVELCQELHGRPWKQVRKGAQKISRASAVLHEIDPHTYPSAESWAESLRDKRTDHYCPVK